jgi:hypothetical protein
VIDFILASGPQAQATMDVFRGTAQRVIALSSGDVYRAAGILHGTEPGPLQPVPSTEDSDLRTHGQIDRQGALRLVFPWLESDYDKIPVERAILSDAELAGTVLRLPMVYGPGHRLHRLHPYLKRMDDSRIAILIQEEAAQWRGPRGYVENVAAGVALAATSPQACASENALQLRSALDHEQCEDSRRAWIFRTGLGGSGYREDYRTGAPEQVDPKQLDSAAEDAALEQLRVREKIALAGW